MKNLVLGLVFSTLILSCQSNSSEVSSEEKEIEVLQDSVVVKEDVALKKAIDFDLPSIIGKQKSLADYKGKLIYLDIWATWCGPCKMQFPVLKQLHEKYTNDDIVILSISIDPDEDKSKWEKMVNEEGLKGEQLFAGQASGFAEAYQVEFIPRFVIISPNGEILMDQAPMPLDFNTGGINPELTKIFDLYIQANK